MSDQEKQKTKPRKPLAERMRPSSLDKYVGQEHITGTDKVLPNMLKSGNISSMIFWGPPGVGKTTLARIIASESGMQLFSLSAVSSGVKEVRQVIETARKLDNALLFIDEIHRFSKSQQDSLLHAVENGTITLIGATTENPGFEVIAPLLSRCQVFVLKSLGKDALLKILNHATEEDVFLKNYHIEFRETDALLRFSGGDARKLLNLLELLIDQTESDPIIVSNHSVLRIAQQAMTRYDKGGDQHYDIISAFIKSIRGSDPNAGIFWLARMIEAGEDPKFIARRLLILASEDIGNANPTALVLANTCFEAVSKIGYPECRIILSQTVAYLASSPKSNAAYTAIDMALAQVKKNGDLGVPLHLRNAPNKLMKELDYGKHYKYAHQFDKNFTLQEYLPESISGMKFYDPGKNAREEEIRKRLKALWKGKYNY